MRTTLSTKGQIVLPAEIRREDGIKPGEQFTFERIDRGEYRLKRIPRPVNDGLVEWLSRCPERGYFEPIPQESTDTL